MWTSVSSINVIIVPTATTKGTELDSEIHKTMLNHPVAIYTLVSSPASLPLALISLYSASSLQMASICIKARYIKETVEGGKRGAFGGALPFLNTGWHTNFFVFQGFMSVSGFRQKNQPLNILFPKVRNSFFPPPFCRSRLQKSPHLFQRLSNSNILFIPLQTFFLWQICNRTLEKPWHFTFFLTRQISSEGANRNNKRQSRNSQRSDLWWRKSRSTVLKQI